MQPVSQLTAGLGLAAGLGEPGSIWGVEHEVPIARQGQMLTDDEVFATMIGGRAEDDRQPGRSRAKQLADRDGTARLDRLVEHAEAADHLPFCQARSVVCRRPALADLSERRQEA